MTTIILKTILTYMAVSILAGFIGVALGRATFAARWLFTPPVFMVLMAGVSMFIAFVRWG